MQMKVYNFGSSHASGYGSDVSYAQYISNTLGAELIDLASPGRCLQHTLAMLISNQKTIETEDVVLVQLRHLQDTDLFVQDNQDGTYNFLSLYSIGQIEKLADKDLARALEQYKVFIANSEYYAFTHALNTHNIVNTVNLLNCKSFLYFDYPMEAVDVSHPVVKDMVDSAYSEMIDTLTLSEFMGNLNFDTASNKNDKVHFNNQAHKAWAEYILTKL